MNKPIDKIIKEVYEEVKTRCYAPTNAYGTGAWDHHIEVVYKLAIKNCEQYHANHDIVALAALLHDVASVTNKDYTEQHHIIGAQIAEDILKKYDLDKESLELIKTCILNHRGSVLMERNTPEEVCIADSDAMAHFYSIPSLLQMVYVEKHMEIDEGSEFVLHKLDRSYNKLSPRGKENILPQYEAAKVLLIKR